MIGFIELAGVCVAMFVRHCPCSSLFAYTLCVLRVYSLIVGLLKDQSGRLGFDIWQ